MKAKELILLLMQVDPESVLVNFGNNGESCVPVEEILIGSLYASPRWSFGGQLIMDGGAMTGNNGAKYMADIQNASLYPVICFK